jgi:ubiquinone/menaquinone biosynthesis C-methylase UbiE
MNNMKWEIREEDGKNILVADGKEYKTYYSKKIIELLIERKGINRTPQYFSLKTERSKQLEPFFLNLNKKGLKGLRILEVGCSSGHITEYLNEQPCISEIHTYDVDQSLVEITQLKVKELNLFKVKSVSFLNNKTSQNLPFNDEHFDIIIVFAVVEHLPVPNRYVYIDEYYRVLRTNGLIGFLDTPNKHFFYEYHSIGLPFLQHMKPHNAYIYAKLFKKKMKNVTFAEFVRAGTAWSNSSYYELLPKTLMIDVKDVSKDYGYNSNIHNSVLQKTISRILKMINVSEPLFCANLEVIFEKTRSYES